jgi:hypothetical protein
MKSYDSFDDNNKKGATKTKTKINKPRNNNSFRRYVLYFFVVLIVFLPQIYIHLNYLPTKESSEIGHGPPHAAQPTIIEQNLESFKNKNKNTTTTTSQQSQSQHDDPTTAHTLAHTDITTNVVDIKKENDISTTTATVSTSTANNNNNNNNLVLTAYLEPPGSIFLTEKEDSNHNNDNIILIRNTSASILRSVTFPNTKNCSTLMQNFPVDNFPLEDPYLPWIHDYFHSLDGKYIQFVAQNRRKCDTGIDHIQTMKFWEPQISLYQKIPIVVEEITTAQQQNQAAAGLSAAATKTTTNYRLATSFQEATHNATRFQCRFHHGNITITTLSVFPFDYEFVTWRKGEHSMYDTKGKDNALFWLSQLMFSCPVPNEFQSLLLSQSSESESESESSTITNNNANNKAYYEQPAVYVDLIPIRTPPRQKDYLLTREQTGLNKFETNEKTDLAKFFGSKYVIPPMDDAGRWQNLPICRRHHHRHFDLHEQVQDQKLSTINAKTNHSTVKREEKPYRLVACTWTSSSYSRRGDEDSISDSAQRLREWIQFHLMVGIDHCEFNPLTMSSLYKYTNYRVFLH